MKTEKKPYSMELRAAAAEATRERILAAAAEAFLEGWYDDVTIAAIAERAGVSGQTVINHFGSKEELATTAYEHVSKEITLRRSEPEPGDVLGALDVLVDDYEITGDAVIRMLALEEKVPMLGATARPRPRWSPRLGGGDVPCPGARARTGGGHRRLHLEAPAPRPGAQPRRDPGGDVANRASSTRTEDSMTTPKRYLFAIIDGGGTVPADTSVIRAMVDRGHDVRVLADRVLAPDIASTGAEHVVWDRAPQRPNLDPQSVIMKDWDTKTPFEAFGRVRDGAMVGPAALFAADVRAELQRRPADVVVGNFFVFGAQIAAEAEGVPFAFLVSNLLSFRGSGTPPLGPGLKPARGPLGRARDAVLNRVMARLFDKGLDQLNEVRRANGLEPIASVLENFERADRLLLMTSSAFEYESFTPPPNVRLVGPRLDDPAWVGSWTPPAGDEPLVLVGMSSTFMDHANALQRAATALAGLPVRGLVTTGPSIPVEAIDAPANVTVVERAPHSEVLRHAKVIVTHAGHGTVLKALAAGVPVVAMPLGRDQLDNAARVVHHGAGLRLKPTGEAGCDREGGPAPARGAVLLGRRRAHGRRDRSGDRRGSGCRRTRGACVARLGRCR